MTATESDGSSTLLSTLEESEKELTLLNSCLASPRQLHAFVTASLRVTDDRAAEGTGLHVTSSLLNDESQRYLKAIHAKYSTSSALRRRLVSANALYYLQCLTDDEGRVAFLSSVADPAFVATSLH